MIQGRSLLFDGAIYATENVTGGAQRQSIKAVTGKWDRVQIVTVLDTISKEPILYLICLCSMRQDMKYTLDHCIYTKNIH